jgi:predicted nucleic acid-binding protein
VIVVADTSPLNYLILTEAIDVLPALFGEVYTPHEVIRELSDADAPGPVRAWALAPPSWLRVRSPHAGLLSTARLDPGEADAISLAKEIVATDILIDERRGRSVARSEGLIVLPTLTVLERAAEKNLVELPVALSKLLRTSFRISREHIDAALVRDAARKSHGC